jgi:hypothetical protein
MRVHGSHAKPLLPDGDDLEENGVESDVVPEERPARQSAAGARSRPPRR